MINNVLQYSDYAAPYGGNFMRSILNLSNTLKEHEIATVYLFPNMAKDKEWIQDLSKTAKVYFYTGNILSDFRLLYKIVKENKIGIIHSHYLQSKNHLLVNLLQMLRPSVKKITHFHTQYYISRNWFKEKCRIWLFTSDAYIGCSMSVAKSIQQASLGMSNVYGIPNAVDFSRLDIINKIDLTQLGISENANTVLMFGYDYFIKGADIAVSAIKDIAEEYNIVLAILLSIRKEEAIRNIESQFGEIPKWIVLLDPREEIASYYHMARIFISPSRSEGLCYSLIEAAYCRRSTIASLIPGHTESKIPHTIYFERNSSHDLQKAILEELSWSNEKKALYSNEAKSYAITTFDLDIWCKKIMKVYEEYNFIHL